jgi:predicted DNA-binding transcriptional regulator YafY
MPVNKNALLRYFTLDECFRNNNILFTKEDLIKRLDKEDIKISDRGLSDDIKFIWENLFKVDREDDVFEPGLKKGKKKAYRYKDTSQSCIPYLAYLPEHIDLIRSAFETLEVLKEIPQFTWIQESLFKLGDSIRAVSKQTQPFVELENTAFADPDYAKLLHKLFDFISHKRVAHIEYQAYGEEKQSIVFHPYYLKQYNGRWFVFGYNEEEDIEDWNISVDDRIKAIKETSKTYRSSSIDWREYFEDIIGVTKYRNKEVEDIVLHFYDKTANYIKSKPLHGSQKAKWLDMNDNVLEVRLQVIPNYELERLILGYGKFVKVISPEHLKNLIANQHAEAAKQYKD